MACKRINSPSCRDDVTAWPTPVINEFKIRMERNRSSKKEPYYVKSKMSKDELPPALEQEMCFNPHGAAFITYVSTDFVCSQ